MTVDSGLILALDTSGDVCSAASVRDGVLISEHIFRHGMHLSERLLDHITEVLADAGGTPEQCDAFAVGLGPGSFTGVRIGIMTIKTFAELLEKPVYATGSLVAMAASVRDIPNAFVVPVHPCRAGVVYSGIYKLTGNAVHTELEAGAYPLAELAATATELKGTLVFCGPAASKDANRELILDTAGIGVERVVFSSVIYPRASEIGRIAAARIEAGDSGTTALSVVPMYISPPPITMGKGLNAPPVATN